MKEHPETIDTPKAVQQWLIEGAKSPHRLSDEILLKILRVFSATEEKTDR